jgi:hypothetical protein
MGGGAACRRFRSARHHPRARFRADRSGSDLAAHREVRVVQSVVRSVGVSNHTRKPPALQEGIKEVVEIRFLLTRSLFGAGIPRRLFLRVSLRKLPSVALPY